MVTFTLRWDHYSQSVRLSTTEHAEMDQRLVLWAMVALSETYARWENRAFSPNRDGYAFAHETLEHFCELLDTFPDWLSSPKGEPIDYEFDFVWDNIPCHRRA